MTLDVLLIILFLIVCILSILFLTKPVKDSFENPVQNINIKDPFDDFYAPVYTTLISDQIKDRSLFEVNELIEKTDLKDYNKPQLLDIGCGGGDHLKLLSNKKIDNLHLTGIDKSNSMLKETKERLGKKHRNSVRLIKKNINTNDLFGPSSFSHIVSYYFTIYLIDSKKFKKNIYNWLKPKGWFVVHIVDLLKFDPILDVASPFIGINPQKYVKNRITESKVYFKKFIYESSFMLSKTKAIFRESFKFKNKPVVRNQKHILKKIDNDKFVEEMGEVGLELKYTTDMSSIGYHNQYLLYFQKT